MENPPFPIGDTSSNTGFPSAMLVYRSVTELSMPQEKQLPTTKLQEAFNFTPPPIA